MEGQCFDHFKFAKSLLSKSKSRMYIQDFFLFFFHSIISWKHNYYSSCIFPDEEYDSLTNLFI